MGFWELGEHSHNLSYWQLHQGYSERGSRRVLRSPQAAWEQLSESPGLGGPSATCLLSAGEGEQQDFCFPEILVGSREWLHRLTGLRAVAGRLQTPALSAFCPAEIPWTSGFVRRKLHLPCADLQGTCLAAGSAERAPLLRQHPDLRLPHCTLRRPFLHARAFWTSICLSGEGRLVD